MKEYAKHYHATRQGNCAQAVSASWAKEYNLSQEETQEMQDKFSNLGSGRAEGGTCGALYAAITLVPKQKESIIEAFKKGAGGFSRCRDIRRNNIIPCNECVGLAAGILDKLKSNNLI